MKKIKKKQILFLTKKLKVILLAFYLLPFTFLNAQQIAILKYNGGGDWYANPTSLPNLAKFCNLNLNLNLNTQIDEVEPGNLRLPVLIKKYIKQNDKYLYYLSLDKEERKLTEEIKKPLKNQFIV